MTLATRCLASELGLLYDVQLLLCEANELKKGKTEKKKKSENEVSF